MHAVTMAASVPDERAVAVASALLAKTKRTDPELAALNVFSTTCGPTVSE